MMKPKKQALQAAKMSYVAKGEDMPKKKAKKTLSKIGNQLNVLKEMK